jgi:DNA-binding IclR family transcriptional regulator
VSGIERAIQILDLLEVGGTPMNGSAIAKGINASASTVYPIIDELLGRQLLSRTEGGNVWLGPRLYRYGLTYGNSLEIVKIAAPVMQQMCIDTGETIQLCGRDGGMMTILAMEEPPGHFRVSSRVGARVPLSWTASGRLLIGHLPPEERRAIYAESAVASPTGRAATDPDELSRQAAEAFGERLSVQLSESDFAVACVASPICDDAGACLATVAVVLPEQRLALQRSRYVEAVQAGSRRIEQGLGFF